MDLTFAFITGFLSSLHCAGMCGPLVLAYASREEQDRPSVLHSIISHLSYNTGRILSYGFVGGLLGLVGGSVGALKGFGSAFSALVGAGTVVFGIHVLRGGSFLPIGNTIPSGRIGEKILEWYRASFGALIAKGSHESKFYIGTLTPLLPCGLLYGMLMRSAGASSAVEGAMMMIAFGAGIVPALVTAGMLGSLLNAKTRQWADSIAALLLILMGVSLVWRAFGAGLLGGSHVM